MLSLLPLLKTMLARQGYFYWRLRGSSMMPTLSPGSLLRVRSLSPSPRSGDIVVFVCADTLVVHRLIRRTERGWLTWGDGCPHPDACVPSSHLLGVVDRVYRAGKLYWPGRLSSLHRQHWLWRRRLALFLYTSSH